MWGNSLDLSIVRNSELLMAVNGTLPSKVDNISDQKRFIMIDHSEMAAKYLCENKKGRVDIVLDNSGISLKGALLSYS